MKKLVLAVLAVSLALSACGKKAVKDPASGSGATAPIVSATPGGGGGGAQASPPSTATSPTARTPAGQVKPASPTPADAASGAGSNRPANASSASPASAGTSSPPGGARPGAEESARATLPGDDYVPGKLAAAKPLEGLPPASAADAGGAVPPRGPAAGLLAQRSVFFAFDSNEVAAEYVPLIEAHAKFLSDHPSAKAILQGNTDERGSSEYNLALGERRADAVRRRLQLLGVAASQIETVSYGSEKPKDPGHDEAAWKQNRRVDIVYRGE